MRIIVPFTTLLLVGATPATALDLSGGGLRGSSTVASAPAVAAIAAADVEIAPSADDELDALMQDEIGDETTASVDPSLVDDAGPAEPTIQEAMMALAPPEPVRETIPLLNPEPVRAVQYGVPRASHSMEVLPRGGWGATGNARRSTVVLGGNWGR